MSTPWRESHGDEHMLPDEIMTSIKQYYLHGLNIYDLMGEDHVIQAKKVKGAIEVRITNDETEVEYADVINKAAWESLVYFARQVIRRDTEINGYSCSMCGHTSSRSGDFYEGGCVNCMGSCME